MLAAEQAALELERSRLGGIEKLVAQLMLENRYLRQRLSQVEAAPSSIGGSYDSEGSHQSEDEAVSEAPSRPSLKSERTSCATAICFLPVYGIKHERAVNRSGLPQACHFG